MHLIGCEFLKIKDPANQPHIASCLYYTIIMGLTKAMKMNTKTPLHSRTVVKGHDHQGLCSSNLKSCVVSC